MKIFFPDVHIFFSQSMARSFDKMGAQMIVPSSDYRPKYRPKPPFGDFVWHEYWTNDLGNDIDKAFPCHGNKELQNVKKIGDNVVAMSLEEIIDCPPDIIFISSFDNHEEVIKSIYAKVKGKSKLVACSVNDYWEGAYDLNTIKNYLAVDYTGYTLAKKYGINHLYYRPEIDYDTFAYQANSDSNIFGSYINNYKSAFSQEYAFVNDLFNSISQLDIKPCDGCTREEMTQRLKESIATMHVKRLEGYGMSIIESMASGRPVFLHRELSQNKSLLNWSIESETAFFFSSPEEFINKALAFYENKEFRHTVQEKCSKRIRQLIDNEEQFYNLKTFLNNLL